MSALTTITKEQSDYISQIPVLPGTGIVAFKIYKFPFLITDGSSPFVIFVSIDPSPSVNESRLTIMSPNKILVSYDLNDIWYWLNPLSEDVDIYKADKAILNFIGSITHRLLHNTPSSSHTNIENLSINEIFLSGKIQSSPSRHTAQSTVPFVTDESAATPFKMLYMHHADLISALTVCGVLKLYDKFTKFVIPSSIDMPKFRLL